MEFCGDTHWLTYQPDPMTVLADVATYDLEYETGVVPIRLVWLKFEGVDRRGWLNGDYTITLAETPSERVVEALTAELTLKPTRSSTSVDVSVYERWAETIAHGAKARLYDIPAQPFTDPQRSTISWAKFRSGMADARADVQRKLTVGPLRVQNRRWV